MGFFYNSSIGYQCLCTSVFMIVLMFEAPLTGIDHSFRTRVRENTRPDENCYHKH